MALQNRARARVFISYARRDGEVFATDLRRRLEREQPEITIWQDRSRMEGGVGWWKQITAALETVQYLVLVMTPAAVVSEESRREWRYARQAGVCVYPVKGAPDAELHFDAMPLWMQKAHFFDLEREWETFVQYLKSPCQADRIPFMAPARARQKPGCRRRPGGKSRLNPYDPTIGLSPRSRGGAELFWSNLIPVILFSLSADRFLLLTSWR